MNKFLIALILLASSTIFACEVPEGAKLIIGCTYKCEFFYRLRLKTSAFWMGYPIKIVDMREMGSVTEAMSKVDGILIPGGADIDPEYYMNDVTPELQVILKQNAHLAKLTEESKFRDPYEHALVKKYSSDERYSKLPMLGICRGMQMMSVAQGIPLYLDLKTEIGINNRMRMFDRVTPIQESLMNSLYGTRIFKGYKLHHQGIRVPYYQEHRTHYPLTKVTAYSNNDKIAESLEYTHRPALGVQYNPEMSFTSTTVPVLHWFLKQACEYKNSQKENQ